MTEAPLYVYGIVRSDATLRAGAPRGVAGGSVRLLEDGSLAAVVTDLPSSSYEAGRGDLLAHSEVLQHAFASADVLPMAFGTAFVSQGELAETFLRPNHGALVAMLDSVGGMAEVQVRADYEQDAIARDIAESDRSVRKLQARARERGDVETKIELGRRFAAALENKRYADARALVDALSKAARDVSLGEAPGEFGLLRASFLVPRAGLDRFDSAADTALASLGGRATLRCVGPLPPYSFVDASALAVA